MYHRIWVGTNIILIVVTFIFIWIVSPHDSSSIIIAQVLAQIGIWLFLININMYFIFLVIRKTKQRIIKINLAKFSRQMMKWHIKIALSGTIIIFGHALINLFEIGKIIGFYSFKLMTGYLALIFLTSTLFAGYLRHKRATGFRRRFHLLTAMAFAVVFLFHIFVHI